MPSTPPIPGPARPTAAELNEQIRALWTGGRGHPTVPLSAEQRAEYERLCAAVREAERIERGDVVEAA
ncbi:hypothetical protein ACIRJM_22655 [Streptomyces sp. NPDC102405]|uniref:hypothetical protein n=1 Tax=Streptomyces sp. NPDC102405 TaxID=3366170 RepID=UPI003828791B